MDNSSYNAILTLIEPTDSKSYRYVYFACMLCVYMLIISANVCLIVTIARERALHQPMYIFLCNLCFNGLYGAQGFYPKFLADLLADSYRISYKMCAVQTFVIYSSVKCEFTILTIMAFDRYVAICKPLDYHSILTKQSCAKLLVFSWASPAISMSIAVILATRLLLCRSAIDKLYCDNGSIAKLSCEPPAINSIYGLIVICIYGIFLIVITISYFKLVLACRSSMDSRKKFLQTCVPHMLSLLNFAVALLFDTVNSMYGSEDLQNSLRDFMALEFMIIPPIFNPLIYGLKLSEVRRRVTRMFKIVI